MRLRRSNSSWLATWMAKVLRRVAPKRIKNGLNLKILANSLQVPRRLEAKAASGDSTLMS